MLLEPPDWWYRANGARDWRARALKPVSAIWGRVAARRIENSQPYRSRLPVICVGNFTAGGTGKTPLVMHLVEQLTARGERPVVLTRGFGARETGPLWVDAGRASARDVGDEPLLLASVAPVMLARDRRKGADAIEASGRDVSVIVMDDGLQNAALAKDLSIAVIDGTRGIGNGLVMPAGPLRAPLAFQLGLVDALVVNGETSDLGAEFPRFKGPVFKGTLEPTGDVDWLKGARVTAYCGIGNPQRFFATLIDHGATLVERVAFADHHPFAKSDAERLEATAIASKSCLVTTEKDWVRIPATDPAFKTLRDCSQVVPVRMTFEPQDQERLLGLVNERLARGRR